jgi:hypothetical protein
MVWHGWTSHHARRLVKGALLGHWGAQCLLVTYWLQSPKQT